MSRVYFAVLLMIPLLSACGPGVSRDEVIATAQRYGQIRWMPEERHVCHGGDGDGQWVHTPDATLGRHAGDPKGWWQPGVEAVGMPYMWGGFDTPESFQRKMRRGYYAGDIATNEKKRLLEAGVSRRAAGIDCSGFVSRCWGLGQAYSTRTLHKVSYPLGRWDELKPGDMLLTRGHAMIFAGWTVPGERVRFYEAGPYPNWKAGASVMHRDALLAQGYSPWRFRWIRD